MTAAAPTPAHWTRRLSTKHTNQTNSDEEMKDDSTSDDAAMDGSNAQSPIRMMILEVTSLGRQIHMYGVTNDGQTVRGEIEQFYPDIYVRPVIQLGDGSKREILESDLPLLKSVLEEELQSSRAAKQLAKASGGAAAASTAAASSPIAKKGAKLDVPAKKGGGRSPSPSPAASSSSSFFGAKKPVKKPAVDEDDEDEDVGDDGPDDEAIDVEEEEEDEGGDSSITSSNSVIAMKLIQKKSLMYYRGDANETFVQIWLSSPTLCTPAHQILTRPRILVKSPVSSTASTTKVCGMCTLVNPASSATCSACDSPLAPSSPTASSTSYSTAAAVSPNSIAAFSFHGEEYGSNIEHYLRFMVATETIGGGWCEFLHYDLVPASSKQTNCALEVKCKWVNDFSKKAGAGDLRPIRGLPNDMTNYSSATIAPLRALSVDCQISVRRDITPDPKIDPIVCIANTVWWFGNVESKKPEALAPIHVLFIVQTALAPTMPSVLQRHPNYELIYCKTESEMLLKWREFFMAIDPDILTGYDVAEKDIPYLLARAERYEKGGGVDLGSPTSASPTASKRAKKSPAASPSMPATPPTTLTSSNFSNWSCLGRDGRTPSSLQNIQTYSAGWVRSKKRMTATSNQASAYFKMEGRLFFDVQRIIQTSYSLRTYSLQEACQEFLKKTEEYLDENILMNLLHESKVALAPSSTSDSTSNTVLPRPASSFRAALDQSTKPTTTPSAAPAKKKLTAAARKRKATTEVGYEEEKSSDAMTSATTAAAPSASTSPSSASSPVIVSCPTLAFNSPLQSFQRFAAYAIRQSELPLRLMSEMMILVASMELARTTGINIRDVWTRGQMIRTWSLLLRHCANSDFLVPSQRDNSQAQTMTSGPYLFDCLGGGNGKNTTGLYTDPVATLDFNSLYPSIMIGHNLSYDTIVVKEDEDKLIPNADTELTPIHRRFVKSSIRKGVIPAILEYLLLARKQVKALMAATQDVLMKGILNERQKALKISANACYGFTGSSASKLLLVELAEATINYGSRMLQQSAVWVEERFGHEKCEVIYGDTDSLMILMKGKTVAQAMELAQKVSKSISDSFPRPITFAYEKIYQPFLLQQNKKYAGVKYTTNPAKFDELDVKGMESVRRDIIMLVRELIHKVLHAILVEGDLTRAITITKQTIAALLADTYPIYDLTITKALWRGTDSAQYGMKLAHIEYAEKLRKRYPGRQIVLGQRVSYVFVQGEKGVKQWQQTEEPTYVDQHGLVLDLELYLQNYLQKPLVRLFCLPGLLGTVEKATKVLFTGDHVRSVKKIGPSAETGLGAFFKKEVSARCTHCKRPITSPSSSSSSSTLKSPTSTSTAAASSKKSPFFSKVTPSKPGPATTSSSTAATTSASSSVMSSKPATSAVVPSTGPNHGLCDSCLLQQDQVFLTRVNEYATREARMTELAQQCHGCQGGGLQLQSILCVNEDCSVYWNRLKAFRGMNASRALLAQLDW